MAGRSQFSLEVWTAREVTAVVWFAFIAFVQLKQLLKGAHVYLEKVKMHKVKNTANGFEMKMGEH